MTIAGGLPAEACFTQDSTPPSPPYSAVTFSEEITLLASPDAIDAVMTGDISPWWDHTMIDKPYAFHIDLVCTYDPSPAGEREPGPATGVRSVCHHLLYEQLTLCSDTGRDTTGR
jgi:hypothetical protein